MGGGGMERAWMYAHIKYIWRILGEFLWPNEKQGDNRKNGLQTGLGVFDGANGSRPTTPL